MKEAPLLTTPETQSEQTITDRATHPRLQSLMVYGLTILLCLWAVYRVMDLRDAKLAVPLYVGHDCTAVMAAVKNLVENGNWYTNRFLGAPGQSEAYDFPAFGFTHLAALKLISLFTLNYVAVMNVYFLLSFPLAAVSSLYVLRRFGISAPAAMMASLLFALAPYHFFRGEMHFFLAIYWVVPLACMVALWVARGEVILGSHRAAGEWFVSRKGAAALAICALMTIDNVYYAFFGAWLLIVAAVIARFRYGRRGAAVTAFILLSVVVLTFVLCLVPNFSYFHSHGPNRSVAMRRPGESEFYGLKMAQLVLPVTGHRLPKLAQLKERYNHAPMVNENDFASLGVVGSCGFILLLAWLLIGRGRNAASEMLGTLGSLTLGAFLLGTIGGVGSLFALLVSPEMRSINRVSIVIAFFSLFAVAVVADEIRERTRSSMGRIAWFGGIVLVLVLGVFDQTTKAFAPNYGAIKSQFDGDADFVKRVEAVVPANAMIYQLPYMSFPESYPIYKLSNYDLLTGYLHSSTLRWSYAAIRGRETDAWIREVAAEPLDQMLNTLVLAGFSGIYVDRYGYWDKGLAVETRLRQIIVEEPIRSSDDRLFFFNLKTPAAVIRARYTNAEWQALHDAAIKPPSVLVSWEPSCSSLEGPPENTWEWCPDQGTWLVSNRSSAPKKVVLDMNFSISRRESTIDREPTADKKPTTAYVRLITPWVGKQIQVSSEGTPFQITLTIPPGDHVFRFSSDAKPLYAPDDPRVMVFRVNNFHLTELP